VVRPLKAGRRPNWPRHSGTRSRADDPARTVRAAAQELRCLPGACARGCRRRGAFGQRRTCDRRGSGRSQRRPSSGTLSRPARPEPAPTRQHQAPTGPISGLGTHRPASWSRPGKTCGGYSGYSEDTAADNVSSLKPRTCRVYSEDTQKWAGDNGGEVRVHAREQWRRLVTCRDRSRG
jgi:hypothetical protein